MLEKFRSKILSLSMIFKRKRKKSLDLENDGKISTLGFNKTFSVLVKVLNIIGLSDFLNPLPETLFAKLRSLAGFVTCFAILAYCVIGQIVNTVLLISSDHPSLADSKLEQAAIQISSIGFCVIGLAKMYSLGYNRKPLTELFSDFHSKWDQETLTTDDRAVRDRSIRPTVTMTTVAVISNIVMVSAFNFLPVLEMIYVRYSTGCWQRQQPYGIWYPCDSKAGIKYYLFYLFEVYAGLIVAVGNVGFNCIFCLLAAHLTVQLKILKNWIEKAVQDGSLDDSRQKLYRTVEFHQTLLECKDTLQQIFSTTLFLNFSGSSILMCLQGYLITTAPEFNVRLKFSLFLICILLEIFFLCYYGEEVLSTSAEIGVAAYSCNWYRMEVTTKDPKFGRDLIPIIQRAQRPMVLMAWKFWPITLTTFSKVLKTTWSYFSLLQTVVE